MKFPYYDRKTELEKLFKLFREETLNKSSFACVITGQKNAGKSELVKQFISHLNSDILISSQITEFDPEKRVITFQCDIKTQKEPYSSFIYITNQILKNQKFRLILSKIFKIVLAVFGVNDALSALTDLAKTISVDKGKNLEKEEIKRFNKYKKFLEKLTVRTPLIFYIKDVQYLDIYSLKLIESILYYPSAFSGAIIFEMNENEGDTDDAVQSIYNFIREGKLNKIHLNPLERDFPSKMLAPIFGEDFFTVEENNIIYTISKGMPGTLIELVTTYQQNGLLTISDGKWIKAGDFKEKIQPKEQQLIDLLILLYTDNKISDSEMLLIKQMTKGWGLSQSYIDFCIKMLSSIISLGYKFEKSLPWGLVSEYVFEVVTPDEKHRIVEYLPVDNNDLPPLRNKPIKHVNLVEALTVKQCDDSILIEWDFLEGKRMREVLFESNNIHLDKCLRLILEIIQGLRELHKFNVIHSYIRPEAIIESNDGKYLLATLDLDVIGFLRDYSKSLYNDSIYYSAPELLADGKPSTRSDIYSLGILLFKLITNTLPFLDLNVKKAKDQILNSRFNFVELRGYNNYDALASFFNKCLMKNPSERYANLDEVISDLQKIQESLSIIPPRDDKKKSQTDGRSTPSKRPIPSYIKKVAVIVLICAVAIMAYIFSDKIMSTMVETKNLDQIVVEITLDKDSANFEKPAVKDVIEFLFQEKILRSGNVSVLSGRQFKRLREADGGVKYLPKLWIKGVLSKSKLGYDLLLSIDSEGERIKDTIISFNEPATFLTDKVTPLTLEIFRLNHIKVIKNIAITESWDAAENFVIGRRAWFRLDKTDAKKAFGKAMSDDPKFTLAKLKYLEVLKFEGGNSSQISTLMSEIKSEISNLSPIDSIRTLAIEKSLNGEFRKAIPFYKQIAEKLPQSKYSYYEIAEAYYELRDNDNAIQYYLKALEKDSVFALALNHLAYSYMDKFEMDKALNCFRKYLSLDKSANSYDSMADGFYAAGMIDSAIIYKRKGIELDPSLEYLHSGLGLFYTMKKDTKNAEFAFNNYFELVKDNQEQSITALFNFAFIAYSKNKLDSAEILIDKSIAKLGNVESIFGYQENFWLKGIILFDKGDYKGLDNIISLFAEAVKKYNFSKEDYHPVYKFFVHLQILKAISDQDKAKVNELMDVLTTDIKFKVRDHGSIFDYAYLSRNLYTVFSSNKFKNDKAANEAKQNAIKANPAYERMF